MILAIVFWNYLGRIGQLKGLPRTQTEVKVYVFMGIKLPLEQHQCKCTQIYTPS